MGLLVPGHLAMSAEEKEGREFIRKRLWDRLMLVGEELSWNRSNQSLVSDIRKLGH